MNRSRLFLNPSELILGGLLVAGLYLTSFYGYLLFHGLVELFSIVVAAGIFILAWNTRRFIQNSALVFIGIGFLFVGGLDLFHTLAYAGMGVFRGETANLPTQLWIAERYLLAGTFLLAPLLVSRRVDARLIFGGFGLVTAFLMVSIFYWRIFPDCYIPDVGLTPFKKIGEYVISSLLVISLGLFWRRRDAFEPQAFSLLGLSIVAGVVTDLTFVLYASVYDIANLIGHLIQLFSFYVIYKAIVETGLVKPFDLVFRDMKQSELALRQAKEQLEGANRELANEVAERRKAEDKVTRLNSELESRAVELEVANKELEAFSYSVSHDLRAPLKSIEGFARVVLQEYGNQLEPEARRLLDLVHRDAQDLDGLVEGLLIFSRLSRQPLKKRMVQPQEMVRGILQELHACEPNERAIEIQLEELPPCEADPVLLKQVWVNLLSNAFKFTRHRERALIHIGSCQEEAEQAYFVRDNGAGFDMDQADRLFGVFQRMHREEEFPGTGVGLAIVARVVKRHGGRVWADAAVDRGATFFFTL